MLCRGTGFQTQFRLKMRRKQSKLCNISFFATLSASIYKLATRDFSLINRGTEWTGSGRTGWFWSRWPTPCIILTTPGEHNRWLLHLKFYHIGQLQKNCLITGQEQACSRITLLFGCRHHAANGLIHRKMIVDCPIDDSLLQTKPD